MYFILSPGIAMTLLDGNMPPRLWDLDAWKCLLLAITSLMLLPIIENTMYSRAMTVGMGGRKNTKITFGTTNSTTSSNGMPTISSWSDVLLEAINVSVIPLSLENHSYWGKAEICATISEANLLEGTNATVAETSTQPAGQTLLNLTFSCEELFHTSPLGTGNWLSALYAIRFAAALEGGNATALLISCNDAMENKPKLILPWVMGVWRPENVLSEIPYGSRFLPPTRQKLCGGYHDVPIAHMLHIIRYELRRMAIALVGVPNADHPSAEFAEKNLWPNTLSAGKNEFRSVMQIPNPKKDEPPLFENISIDDAVVHFRCGE